MSTHPIERYRALRDSAPCPSHAAISRRAPSWSLEEARTREHQPYRRRVSTDRLSREGSQLTASLEGLDNSGKSTLLHRLSQGQVTALQPTERPHIDEFQLGGVSFKAWDLGGHEAVRYLWFDFLSDSHAIVFMVDSADDQRLDEAHWELSELLSDASFYGVPVAVLYNKSDLPTAVPEEKLRGMLDIERLETRRPIKCFVTSVVKGEGYPEAFRWLGSHL